MPGPGSMPCPKPEPKAKSKARAKRHEAAIIQQVRAQCVERDGHCRIGSATTHLGACTVWSQWCHMEDKRRSKTLGQEPEVRHTTQGSFMGCAKHHGMYDSHELQITAIDSAKGADGVLRITRGDVSVLSVPRRSE
jgi:hypothetical protein